jgi:hypothetical protein
MALRKKTIDLLDAHITSENDGYIGGNEYSRNKVFTENFRLDSVNWETYHAAFSTTLTAHGITPVWDEFKYVDVFTQRDLIEKKITTNDTGIYLFIVKSQHQIYDYSRFVLYVGISGENGSGRPLKDRLQDYFRLTSISKRDAVLRMLEKYKNNVHIAYFLANVNYTILKELESALIGFFYPLANKDDFPIELQPSKKSF